MKPYLNVCCDMLFPFEYDSYFLGVIPVGHTIICLKCGMHVTAINRDRAIKKWNKKVSKYGNLS